MSGNSIGKLFCVTSFGESHGKAIGCVVDGCPPGLELSEADIQPDLDRRKPGTSKFVTQRKEADAVTILSGVFEGKTTGTPIALLIENSNQRSQDYAEIAQQFRPSHADYTYYKKYGIRDYRGGGRASARETAVRVAAAVIAKKYLKQQYNIQINGYCSQIGNIKASQVDIDFAQQNPFFFADASKINELERLMADIRKNGDSVGARINVVADNVPPGLGEPVFDRLDADLAHALMSINAVKGVEIGAGFDCISQLGSEHRDQISPSGFLSNNAGGILGGISSGQQITASIAIKPTSSILIRGQSINQKGEPVALRTKGRHDPCVGIRATPIAEAMLALVLMDHLMRHLGQCSTVSTALNIPPQA